MNNNFNLNENINNDIDLLSNYLNKSEYKNAFDSNLNYKIIKCKYNSNYFCNVNDFVWYYDYIYGNCYRFNIGKDFNNTLIKLKYINNPGKMNAFQLDFFIGFNENDNFETNQKFKGNLFYILFIKKFNFVVKLFLLFLSKSLK